MNAPTCLEWATWFLTLGLLGLVIPMFARLLGSLSRASSVQQTIWRGAFLVLLIVSIAESFGTYGTFSDWWNPSGRVEGTWSVSVAHKPLLDTPMKGEASRPVIPSLLASQETTWFHSRTWIPGGIFLGGVVCGLVYWIVLRLGLALYVMRYSMPAYDPTIHCFQQTLSRLNYKGKCRLRVSSGTLGPFAFGTLWPTILVPFQMVNEFSEEESALVFAHEVAHLKNSDNIWQPLVDLVTLLFWWHPLIWWARQNLVASGEFAADSRAVGADYSPESLAACLVKFGRRAWERHRLAVLFQNGTAFHSALGRRVERLLRGSVSEDFRVSKRLALSTGMVLLMAGFYIAFSRLVFPGLAAATPVGQVVFDRSASADGVSQASNDSMGSSTEMPITESQKGSLDVGADNLKEDEGLEGLSRFSVGTPDEAVENPDAETLADDESEELEAGHSGAKFVTKRFRIDPHHAMLALRENVGFESEGVVDSSDLPLMLRRLFRGAGITLSLDANDVGDQSKPAIIVNSVNGFGVARVLESEVDLLDEMIRFITVAPSQLTVSVEMVELPKRLSSLLREAYPSLKPNESKPDDSHSVLDESEYENLRDHFLSRSVGASVLSAPKVTTLSGRVALLSMHQRQTIVFPQDYEQGKGTPLYSESSELSKSDRDDEVGYLTRSIEIGPSLRILPWVDTGASEIDLDIRFMMREFVGYDDPGPAMVVIDGGEKKMSSQIPLPRFRERETKASMRVQDGQVVMLRGMTATNIRKKKDKVPVLGDIPLVGRLFRKETTETEEKELLIFVKANQIDPAGNRRFPPKESK